MENLLSLVVTKCIISSRSSWESFFLNTAPGVEIGTLARTDLEQCAHCSNLDKSAFSAPSLASFSM